MARLRLISLVSHWSALVLLHWASTAAAQGPDIALPPLMGGELEIALARSAAPPNVSSDATILVLQRGGFVRAREGSNGFTCMVDRYYVQALEPTCFNPEASETILPVLVRRTELREMGLSAGEIDREIEAAYGRGEFRLPERLAIGYMFSSDQNLYSDSGQQLGSWMPHLMIYVPYLNSEVIGGRRERGSDPVVFRAGRRDAALIVPVPAFVDPGM